MKTTSILALLLLAVILPAAPVHAAAYLKWEGVTGDSADPKHDKWVILESPSWTPAGASGNRVQGNYIGTNACATGSLSFRTKGTPLPLLSQQCASRVPVPMPVYSLDGVTHTLEGAKFTSCQGSSAAPTDQFMLTFTKCRTHGSATTATRSRATSVRATITGLPTSATASAPSVSEIVVTKAQDAASAPSISEVVVTKVSTAGNRATLILGGTALLQRISALGPGKTLDIPELRLAVNGGPTWTYSGAHVIYQDITIPATATDPGRRVQLTIDFQRMTGPATWEPPAQ